MSNLETLSRTPVLKRPDTLQAGSMTARVVEVGEITAGIAVPEHGGVRFYSSTRVFDALDGQLFRSFEQANRAARERVHSHGRPPVHRIERRLRVV